MTDAKKAAQLEAALQELRLTQEGYRTHPGGPHWRRAIPAIEEVIRELRQPVPALGPLIRGGKSVLLHDCTHITDELGWPAFDDALFFDKRDVGRAVLAPEACLVYDNTSGAQGGDAFYVRGASGIRYWVGHITTVPALNRRFKK